MDITAKDGPQNDNGASPQGSNGKRAVESKSAQPHEERSPIDGVPSLAFYFADKNLNPQKCDSEWLLKTANAVLNAQAGEPECLYNFAKGWLAERLMFGPAAKVFALALAKYGNVNDLFSNLLRQQLAVATYKNEEAPTRQRLEAALGILKDVPSLSGSSGVTLDNDLADQAETWALWGAVYRRFFDLDGKPQYLHLALDYCRRSHACDRQRDDHHVTGYGAVNAAFLLDLLAFHLESIGNGPILKEAAKKARNESEELRREVIDRLERRLAIPEQDQEEWLCETIAGAYLPLGLARWTSEHLNPAGTDKTESADKLLDRARQWAEKAVQQDRADWKRETTYSQWLRVAYLNEPPSAPREVLERYWNATAAVINPFRQKSHGIELSGWDMAGSARRGKVGLALSGGGFRASFYHLGVLARLAEVDALRHIDVLSTVSGGSIVGAHYYLLLRQLLMEKANPSRDDYVELVTNLQQQFCAGVDANLRMRGLSNPWVMLKLLFKPHYTRSDRMAELYDELLFARTNKVKTEDAKPEKAKPKGRKPERFPLNSLRITPKGESHTFNPRFSNWRRSGRVPALLINATCLNTGHSWHFTANWMGEPPELIGATVDKNERLRRMPYDKAPGYESLSLGFAVAASACVPGIFEPLRLPRLYPGRLVRLVDGGVHDNQGVDALLGQGCDFVLCSDGSGQIGDETHPPNGPVGTPKRSMDILMKRVREAEHADVENRVITGTRRGLFFVHLKSELPIDDVDWVGCDDPSRPQPRQPMSYGIDRQIQRYLSEIRTDLDAFSEVEAYALMTSGYAMTCRTLEQLNQQSTSRHDCYPWGGFDVNAPTERSQWGFLRLQAKMAIAPDTSDIVREDLGRQLRAGRDLFFKQITLMPQWLLTGLLVGVLLLAGGSIWTLASNIGSMLKQLEDSHWSPSYAILLTMIVATASAVAIPRARVWCFESFFAVAGALVSNLYFGFGLNRLFLERGRLDRLSQRK